MRAIVLAAAILALPALAAAQPSGVTPGQWEIDVTVNSMESPSLPPAIAKMMAGKTVTVKHCLTPDEAQRGPQEMLKTGKNCVFDSYSMVGGRLNSAMTCGDTHAVTTGTFTATAFTASGKAQVGGSTPMTVASTSVGRRVGDCQK